MTALDRLIETLAKMPGLGRKSASRLAYYLLKADASFAQGLARDLVQLKERVIEGRLIRERAASQGSRDAGADVFDGLTASEAGVTPGVTVAQFERLAGAGRGAGGHRSPGPRLALQATGGLHGGTAPAVEDLEGVQLLEAIHAPRG